MCQNGSQRQPGGDVTVTIRRLYPADRALMGWIFPTDVRDPYAAVEIRPSALPAGRAVYINDTSNPDGYLDLTAGLVRTGPRCTISG
jgi:hypothetical protein